MTRWVNIANGTQSNDISISLRHIMYDNDKPTDILLMFMSPVGIPLVPPRLDHIMHIFSGAMTTTILPTNKAQTKPLEEILIMTTKMVGGLIRIDTSHPGFERLTTYKDILIRLAGPHHREILSRMGNAQLLDMHECLETVECNTTKKNS